MSDLTKLTAEELLADELTTPFMPWMAEIRRRLERLETLEPLYAASESLRRQMQEQTIKDLAVFQQVRERLEQCEALLNAYRKIHDGNAIDDSSGAVDQCGCKLCDAARAVVEEK